MQIETFRRLLTPAGQEALHAAQALQPREEDFLAHFQGLTRHYDADLARAVLEVSISRRKAASKFPFAEKLYFTREALEQASSWEIATYRAERFRPFERLADLGCSAGSDSLALAGVAPTVGIDLDRLRLGMAQANARAMGLDPRLTFAQADLRKAVPLYAGRHQLGAVLRPRAARRGEAPAVGTGVRAAAGCDPGLAARLPGIGGEDLTRGEAGGS